MSFAKFSLLSLFCVGAFALSSADGLSVQHGAAANNFDVKSLAWKDRFFFHLINKLAPETFKGMPADILAELSEYPEYPGVDNFFIDFKQLFIQSKKLTENSNLPEFNWGYRYDFCIWIICLDFETKYSTSGTQFFGTDTIKSSTNITPTRIENVFEVPFFNWTSPGFLFNLTNYMTERIHLSGNSFVLFSNVSIAFQCDYHFVPDIGVQVANISIYFNAGMVRGWLWDFTTWDFQGNLLETYYPEKYNYDEVMMDYWNWAKRDYSKGLEYSLNCFLSNGRSDPPRCYNETGYLNDDYYRLLNMQFIQTMGLGALL